MHFANLTGPLYDAGKEWRRQSTFNRLLYIVAMQRSCTHKLFYRGWLVLLRWHSWSYPGGRRRTLRRFARSSDRRPQIGQNGDRYWLLDRCLRNQPPGPLVGHARCGFQFWHRHFSHLRSLQFHKQRPSHECRLQVPCQSEWIPLRVCAVFHWQTSGHLLNRHSSGL